MKRILFIIILITLPVLLFATSGASLIDTNWLDEITDFLSGRLAMGIGILMFVIAAIIYISGQGSEGAKVMAFKICVGLGVAINAASLVTRLFGAGILY